jgi:hypothetical protein
MLTIRAEQMERFEEAATKGFEDRMLPFLTSYFPEQSKQLGEENIRALIQYGISRSRAYGIVTEIDVGQYIALMFIFGGNFDTDPTYPSLRRILVDPKFKDQPGSMIQALYTAAEQEIRQRTNPDSAGEPK